MAIRDYKIIYNWDGNPLSYTEHPQSVEQLLDKTYAPIRDTQIGAHFWCIGEQEAKWPSQDIQMAGDAVDRVYETVWNMRKAESVRAMFERGDDPYGDMVRYGHDLGVDVWASERKNHPEWTLGDNIEPWVATSWNMAIPEVRELRLKFIKEALQQADWDGVELDWQRHGFHLPTHDGYRLSYVITDLQRAVRQVTDEIAKERGRPFYVAVRVASTLESCRRIGYDIETWADEALCDLIVPGGNSSTDPGIDMEGFRQIIDGTDIKLYPGLDTDLRVRADRLVPHDVWRDAWVLGEAAKFWDQGADGMYVFNWHATEQTRRSLLTTIGAPATVAGTDKVYATLHGTNAAKGTLRYGADSHDRIYAETPVTLYPTLTDEGPTFHVPLYDDLLQAKSPAVELQIEIEHFSPKVDKLAVNIDSTGLGEPTVRNVASENPDDPATVSENFWLVWLLDPKHLFIGVHEVQTRLIARDRRLSVPLVVRHVEIHVTYSRTGETS
jgi:hypothetical protein